MSTKCKNLDLLNLQIKNTIIPFCEKLITHFQDNIISIFIYGSAAIGGDYIHKRSDINILALFESISFRDIDLVLPLIKDGQKKGISAPLFLTKEHILSSTDIFPIEFLEMKDTHLTIYGPDLLMDLSIDLKNLRLQCENQIKGKLIRIRQTYLEIGKNKKSTNLLLTESLTTLIPVMRNMLRLAQVDPLPKQKEAILNSLCSKFTLDNEILLDILRLKRGEKKLTTVDSKKLFSGYLDTLTKLSKIIDKLDPNISL